LISGRDAVMAAVNDWLNTTSAKHVIEAAKSEKDIATEILAKHSKSQIKLALSLLGARGLSELRQLNSVSNLQWVIDELLRKRRSVGISLWQHDEWFLRQIVTVITAFLAEADVAAARV